MTNSRNFCSLQKAIVPNANSKHDLFGKRRTRVNCVQMVQFVHNIRRNPQLLFTAAQLQIGLELAISAHKQTMDNVVYICNFPFETPSPPCFASPIEESGVVVALEALYSFILQFSFIHLSSQPSQLPPPTSMLPQLICWLIPLLSPEESDQASGWSEQCRFFIKTKLSVFLVEPVGAPLMKVIRRQGGQNNKSFS